MLLARSGDAANMTQITMHYGDQPCRRLIASDWLPDRAGQPTQIQLLASVLRTRRPAQAGRERQPARRRMALTSSRRGGGPAAEHDVGKPVHLAVRPMR
jgi:hypothetical protein